MTTEKDLENVPEVPVTLAPPRFANPWQGLKGDPTASTVNCLMPKDAFNRVKSCRLEGGTIQTTMNHLWIKLIDLLERKQIYGYESVREFEDAVKRSVLVMPEDLAGGGPSERSELPRSTAPQPDTANGSNDVAGAAQQLRDPATSEPKQPNLPSEPSQGGGERSKGKPKRSKGKSK